MLREVVQSALDKGSAELLAITGPRGVGKTNLLRVSLADTNEDWIGLRLASQPVTIQRGLGKTASNEVISAMVSATLKAVAPYSLWYRTSGFLQHFLSRFPISIGGYSAEVKEARLQDLLVLLGKASGLLRRVQPPLLLTLIFDESDRLLEDYPEFAEFLRQILESLNSPMLVIVSGLPVTWPRLLSGHLSIARSANRIKLQPLQLEEVEMLISKSITLANTTNEFPIQVGATFAKAVFDLTGGHPYLVHLLGDHCYQQLLPEKGEVGLRFDIQKLSNGRNQLTQKFAEDVFEPWMKDLSHPSKSVLLDLVTLRGEMRRRIEVHNHLAKRHNQSDIDKALAELEEWGIVNSDLQIVSSAFAKWLQRMPPND